MEGNTRARISQLILPEKARGEQRKLASEEFAAADVAMLQILPRQVDAVFSFCKSKAEAIPL
jgi:hypothetical protein